MEWPAYRCFLPDLTGFAGFHCVGPDSQRCAPADSLAGRPLGRGFSPAVADCGYRAPLAPRLARPVFDTKPLDGLKQTCGGLPRASPVRFRGCGEEVAPASVAAATPMSVAGPSPLRCVSQSQRQPVDVVLLAWGHLEAEVLHEARHAGVDGEYVAVDLHDVAVASGLDKCFHEF